MIATGMVAGCETVRQVKSGCYGFWVENSEGHKRGTRWSNRENLRPYRQCVDQESPHLDKERRPYG